MHHRQPAESSQIGPLPDTQLRRERDLTATTERRYLRRMQPREGPLPDTQLRRERDLTATTNLGKAIQSKVGHLWSADFDGSGHSRRRPKYDDGSGSGTSTDPSGALGSWTESWYTNFRYQW